MQNRNTITNVSKLRYMIVVLLVIMTVVMFAGLNTLHAAPGEVPGEAYGWYNLTAEYLGPTTLCALDEVEHSVELKEFNSMHPMTNWQDVEVNLQVISSGVIITQTGWQTTNISESVCYDPISSSVRTQVRSKDLSGAYHSSRWWWSPESLDERVNMRGRHMRIYAHPQPLSEPQPLAEIISPKNDIVDHNPPIRFRVNRDPNLYDTSSLDWVRYNLASQTLDERIVDNRMYFINGIGTYNFGGSEELVDDLYRWSMGFGSLAGPSYDGGDIAYVGSVVTNVWSSVFFRIDSTPPTADATYDVGDTIRVGESFFHDVTFTVTAQDEGVGLANIQLRLRSKDDPDEIIAIDFNDFDDFDVADGGLVGGSTAEEIVTFEMGLPANGNFEYSVEVTDAIGNSYIIDWEDVVLPDLPLLNGESCTINIGGNTCQGMITWGGGSSVYNATPNREEEISSDGQGTASITLVHGDNIVHLLNESGSILTDLMIDARCSGDAVWSSSQNACAPLPPDVSVTLWVDGAEQSSVPTLTLDQDVVVLWQTTPAATTCEWVNDYGGALPPVSGASGSVGIPVEDLESGETLAFTIRCRRTESGIHSQWAQDSVSSIMFAPDVRISLDRTIVRVGDTATASWSVGNIPSGGLATPLSCRIALPGRSPINREVNNNMSEEIETGPVFNAFEATITCTEQTFGSVFEDSQLIEVVPALQER